MKKTLTLISVLVAAPPTTAPRKPKLVLAIAVDQFRYDYLAIARRIHGRIELSAYRRRRVYERQLRALANRHSDRP